MTTATDFVQDLWKYRHDPKQMIMVTNRLLEDTANIRLPNPTNPLSFALETTACMVSAAIQESSIQTRKQYPIVAQTPEDLYYHMSDRDYIGRFALPSHTTFTLMLNKAEVIKRMVTDPISGVRKIIIPRNSIFKAGEYQFSIQYPIEIRQMKHGGLQVVWDTSVKSPLKLMESNLIDWEVVVPVNEDDVEDKQYLMMRIPVDQFAITTQYVNIDATGASLSIPFENEFYYVRAWLQNDDNTYTEMKTTHSDQIYDPAVPTLSVRVIGNILNCYLPHIYISQGIPRSKIRIDIYTTHGKMELDLAHYDRSIFQANWYAIDAKDRSIYSAPLDQFKSLTEVIVYSDDVVTAGRPSLSFEQLRSRMIYNAFSEQIIPITPAQIETALEDLGYEVVKNLDLITARQYLATKPMPEPIDPSLITAASAGVMTLTTTLKDASAYPGVITNLHSITLTPKVLYKAVSNSLHMVAQSEMDEISSMPVETRVLELSKRRYQHSPYYYVLDTKNQIFDVRAYELDTPKLIVRTAVDDNDTTQMQVNIRTVEINRKEYGYQILVRTRSDERYKAIEDHRVFAQLAWLADEEKDYTYILGSVYGYSGDDRIFEFQLRTNHAIDEHDRIPITSQIYTEDDRYMFSRLIQDFQIVFSTIEPADPDWQRKPIDNMLGIHQLPPDVYAINHESIRIQLGSRLHHLWTRARSNPKPNTFEYYQVDVPLLYEQDVYENGLENGLTVVNGQIKYKLLHKKGDPVLDADGKPRYKHRAGDVIMDSGTGDYLTDTPDGLVSARAILRRIDITIIDGLYWFATDMAAKTYRDSLVRFMTAWLTNDFNTLTQKLLEQTEVFFHPKTSLGSISCMVYSGQQTTLDAEQSYYVQLHVPASTYNNMDLRREITTNTIKVIANQLAQDQITTSGIVEALRDSYSEDVIDVEVNCTSSMKNYNAVTVLDPSRRFILKKKLRAITNDTLVIIEDVTVDFVRHSIG